MKLQANKAIFQHARFHPRDVSAVSDSGPRARGNGVLSAAFSLRHKPARNARRLCTCFVFTRCLRFQRKRWRRMPRQPTNKTGYPTPPRPCSRPLGFLSTRNPCHMTNLNVIYHQFQPSIAVDPESSVGIKLGAIISMTCLSVLRGSLNIKESLISSNPAC